MTERKTVASQGSITSTIDCSKTGYTPIGILQLQNNSGSTIVINGYWFSGSILNIYNKNISSSQITDFYNIATVCHAKTELFNNN